MKTLYSHECVLFAAIAPTHNKERACPMATLLISDQQKPLGLVKSTEMFLTLE